MCQQLPQIAACLRTFTTDFDAAVLSCGDAATIVKHATAIEHMAATIKALAAARAAQAKTWNTEGHRSAEEQLAHATGTTVAGARDALSLGRRLAAQPEVAAAARQGQLSPTQAAAITDAVAADPTAAAGLLDAARAGGSVADLKDQCAAVKAAALDLDARRREIHSNRGLRAWTDRNGVWHLAGQGNPEHGAQIMAAISPRADEAFRQARADGRRERPDAYRFDALHQLALDDTSDNRVNRDQADADAGGDVARASVNNGTDVAAGTDTTGGTDARPTASGAEPNDTPVPTIQPRKDDRPPDASTSAPFAGRGVGLDTPASLAPSNKRPTRRTTPRARRGAPVKLLIRVDLETFLRGFPADGETCDLVGYGPISVTAVNDLLRDGDPFVAAILTKGKRLLGVAHLGRQPTAHQKSALEWLHPTCAAAGCPASARLEKDHRIDWSQTHITLLDWLDCLCHHHHSLKTRNNWALVAGSGKRPFVPPDDPRHPEYGRRAAA